MATKKKKRTKRMPRANQRPEHLDPRYERALALRAEGQTLAKIGEELGVSHVQAGLYVERALAQVRESTRETAIDYVQIEVARLDKIMLAHWQYAIKPVLDKDGIPSTKSAELVLKCIKQRSDLLGLNAPTRVEVGVNFNPQPLDLSVYTESELDTLQGLLAKQAWGPRLLEAARDPVLDAEFSED